MSAVIDGELRHGTPVASVAQLPADDSDGRRGGGGLAAGRTATPMT
ncbi:hypothetical protein [Mycobacterium intracellulare]|nr:hypothetical protein KN247_25985 [Mycobacterium intracellulare]